MSNGWLSDLKRGDGVIVRNGGSYGGASVATVNRVTKTRLMVTTGKAAISEAPIETAFRIADGHQVGGGAYSGMRLEQATPASVLAVRNENRRRRIARELNHRNWENVPLEILDQISAILYRSGSPTE